MGYQFLKNVFLCHFFCMLCCYLVFTFIIFEPITFLNQTILEHKVNDFFRLNWYPIAKNMDLYSLQVKYTMDWLPYMTMDKWVSN